MPKVVFAIGSNPDISAVEALDLAELLVRRRNYAAFTVGTRIRSAIDPDHPDGGISTLITLTPEQMEQIALVLDESSVLVSAPRFANLRSEIRAAARADAQPEGHGLRLPRSAQLADDPATVEDTAPSRETSQRRAS
jgi:hypothetical protein